MKIGNKEILKRGKPFFIADIAANHDGDLERAYKLIELAKEAGADVAKFQNFNAKTIVSKKGFETLGKQLSHQANWKKSVYEVYEDASINPNWTELLKKKCDEVGIEYMTSPYDYASVDLVDPYVNAYKIGSGDITWTEILRYILSKKKPVLLATGASSMEDVDRAMDILKASQDIVLMQCNTNYKDSTENFKYINLNVLKKYEEKYPNVILGLSDHTKGFSTVLGAIALGAVVIEKHFTDDNDREGPDHKFAMNPKTWREIVDALLELYYSLGDGNKRIEKNEEDTAMVQRRGIYVTKSLKAGHILTKEDLIALRPYEIDLLLGKKLIKNIESDSHLTWKDVE